MQTQEYAQEETWQPHIVTSLDVKEDEMRRRSTSPMPSFTSPFVGKTFNEINEIFLKHIVPLDLLTNRLFIILDEQSIENDSCLIVLGGEDFDPDDEMTFLRTDFYVAMNMVSRAEMGVTDLGENLERDQVWGVHNLANF